MNLAETEAGRRPDLIVGDYQLSRGLTGAFGKIPALLISAQRVEIGLAHRMLRPPGFGCVVPEPGLPCLFCSIPEL